MAYREVGYGPDRYAWWIDAGPLAPAIVMVHGYDARRGSEFEPQLELAASFQDWGYSTLIIDLGYVSGAHRYSGGPLEADDVKLAVDWVRAHTRGPIALWGSSAGGHAVVLAAGLGAPVSAVVTDSAFVDARQVIPDLLASLTHLPAVVFGLVPVLMGRLAPPGPVDLVRGLAGRTFVIPALHIHGTADTAIPISNLETLARLTQGDTWIVAGGEHNKGFFAKPADYRDRVHAFLGDHLVDA